MNATSTPDRAAQCADRAPTPDADQSTYVPAGRHALRHRPLLLAMDDGLPARAAARVAAALEHARGARPVVLRAVAPTTLAIPFAAVGLGLADTAVADDTLRRSETLAVRRDLRAALGDEAGTLAEWPVVVSVGAAGEMIAERARHIGASLTVLGLRPHRGLSGFFHDATVLGAARDATTPLLAVTADAFGLPTRVIVGVDFGRAGLLAARWALTLLAHGGTLVLAYVAPSDVTRGGEAGEGERVIRAQGVAAAFARLRVELRAPHDVRVENAVLQGSPAGELLALAERVEADCIAVGSRRHGTLERWLLGSVTAELVQSGMRSLLVVPPCREIPDACPPGGR